jgi:hypothetical protein
VGCDCSKPACPLLTGIATAAIECQVGGPNNLDPVIISSLEELRATIPRNCTTVIGSITIAKNFTGQFALNGPTKWIGSIASFGALDGTGGSVPNLTTIDLPDLLSFEQDQFRRHGEIILENVPNLQWVNIPKATFISSLLVGGFADVAFDLSSLASSDSIEIIGGYISRY